MYDSRLLAIFFKIRISGFRHRFPNFPYTGEILITECIKKLKSILGDNSHHIPYTLTYNARLAVVVLFILKQTENDTRIVLCLLASSYLHNKINNNSCVVEILILYVLLYCHDHVVDCVVTVY